MERYDANESFSDGSPVTITYNHWDIKKTEMLKEVFTRTFD